MAIRNRRVIGSITEAFARAGPPFPISISSRIRAKIRRDEFLDRTGTLTPGAVDDRNEGTWLLLYPDFAHVS
jgi:hypothetical protein